MEEQYSKPVVTLLGGIEAGGTKFNCVIGTAAGEILETGVFPTRSPEETLLDVCQFFRRHEQRHGAIRALGVASFGPVDLDPVSIFYGRILSTPKPGWSNIDLLGRLRAELRLPVAFETDVNGSALGEYRFGAGRGVENFAYVTVGTGLGGGVIINGRLLQGISHPELGHMLIPHDRTRDDFEGCCPFHGDCLEGLASGTALGKRWGVSAAELPVGHPAWELEAHYLALMCVNLTQCYAPQKIILGGGVMSQAHLFPLIHREFLRLINGYVPGAVSRDPQNYIVPPECQGLSGQLGALILAEAALAAE